MHSEEIIFQGSLYITDIAIFLETQKRQKNPEKGASQGS
jgi:hypothetical protein